MRVGCERAILLGPAPSSGRPPAPFPRHPNCLDLRATSVPSNRSPAAFDQMEFDVDALNTLRAILVGFTAIAAVMLGFRGEWFPAGVLGAGILAHMVLFAYLRAQRRRDAEQDPLHELLGN